MVTIDLTTPPPVPASFLDGLARRLALTLPELRAVMTREEAGFVVRRRGEVLALTRNALGLPTSPPNQVLTGIALFLTIFVMGPVFGDINDVAQAVQRSGYPEAYRDHEADARVLAALGVGATSDADRLAAKLADERV